MLIMILQMTGTVALYIVATVLLWRSWHKKEGHSLAQKLAVGLFYGLCSIASNHFGVDYGVMVLNVRDLGPLAAGLFFSPLSGILSGLIGAVERYIIGTWFDIGSFSRIACSLSTFLAGLLAAVLNKWVYEGDRPSVIHSVFLGAEMEVFHMYAVFLTHRDDMATASFVVSNCALPMIIFTAVGLGACSAIIQRLSGIRWKMFRPLPKRDTPIDTGFQRWLLLVTVLLFISSAAMNYSLQTRSALESASNELYIQWVQYQISYKNFNQVDDLVSTLDEVNYWTDTLSVLVDVQKDQVLAGINDGEDTEPKPLDPQEKALILEHAGGDMFTASLNEFMYEECMCISARIDDAYYMVVALPMSTVYASRNAQMLETLFLEILIFTAFYLLISVLLDRIIVRNLGKVNQALSRITSGHLNETVAVEEYKEFTELSGDINEMVTALRGYIDAAEKRMEKDLTLAADIQDAALPKNFNLPTANIELSALMTPARQVGGDFYDFFYINIGQLALVIADVSGKGVPAAMFMMRAKTAIKNYARSGMGPAQLLEKVNSTLCEGNDAGMFVTVWLGILDVNTGLMRCSNAGHEFPVLMKAGGDYELYKDKHGVVLAAYDGVPRKEYEIQLEPGDRFFVYTDGVPEATCKGNEQYGTQRMTACLNTLKDKPQKQMLDGLLEDIRTFAGEEEQFDDITMLGFTYNAPVPRPQSPGSHES